MGWSINGSNKVVDSPYMSLELCNDGGGSDQVVRWGSGIGVPSFLDFRLGHFLALIVM